MRQLFHIWILAVIFTLSACLVQADSLTEEFMQEVTPEVALNARPFALGDVRLLDGPFKTAMEHNARWPLELEPDRFLAWFRREAGLEARAEVYGGWEQETIAGHSLGHYMTACALMYQATSDEAFRQRCDYIVDELALIQEAHGSGYMSAFPNGKTAFEEISQGNIRSSGFDLNGIWVPWYTQHKLKAGLRDIYQYTGNSKALELWIAHADWIDDLLADLDQRQWQDMLDCEHGGINETFADLYAITGRQRYLQLAEKFYHNRVLDPLSRREDILPGLHANTQIPKVIGAARLYELTGNRRYHTIADFFWTKVIDYYTYANGGNTAEEYFQRAGHLSERMNDTTEACNTYNMLRLTRHLFAWQPDAAYMDYYERALLNHILAHQHPDQGGRLKYKGFLDMPARKGFSHPTRSFWCCVGTGMENHTKYADTIYAYNDRTLYVNLFISSVLQWQEKGVTLTQHSRLPSEGVVRLSFDCSGPVDIDLRIRKPYWADEVTLKVNEDPYQAELGEDGYLRLDRRFSDGDVVELNMPMSLHVSTLPDMENRTAFLYGPTLLAAKLQDGQLPPTLVAQDTDAMLAKLRQQRHLVFTSETLAHRAGENGWQSCDLKLVPFYSVAEQPYTVYMDVYDADAWQEKQAEYAARQRQVRQIEAASIDYLQLGQMQPERDHNLTAENSNVGSFAGRMWRDAYNGWFEFDMDVLPDQPVDLIFTYWGSERGRRVFDILVDGENIATQILDRNRPNEFFDVTYEVPSELTRGKRTIRVRVQSQPNSYAGGVFSVRALRRQQSGGQAGIWKEFVALERDYPYRPVPFTHVSFNDRFWSLRVETNRTVTIPHAFEQCQQSQRFYHFERAAKVLQGLQLDDLSPPGLTFDDTDPYKVLEGAAYGLAVSYDRQMDAWLDEVIELIASAQEPDGYLFTARTINPDNPHEWAGPERWIYVKDLSHELYNMGHLYEAAVAHYQATGKRSLLDVAVKNAELLYETFGPGKNEDAPGHQIIEMALVRLYRVTGEERYLELARFFLDTRGPGDGQYSQAHKRVTDQSQAVGHAVRATYMYSGMADVAALTGDDDYINAMDRIWDNMASKKLYITGGIGATASGEAFGPNYVLPNMSAYAETCAAIGNVYWNHRMFLLHGDSKYIDVMERTLYNGLISGVSLCGTQFFYPNPLESRGQHQRQRWFGCACCPGNVARFMASVPGYVYATRDSSIYVNLYVAGSATVPVNDNIVKIDQETDYPWQGDIKLTVEPQEQADFTISLRIPGWAMDRPVVTDLYRYIDTADLQPTLKVNGRSVPVETVNGYVRIGRQWRSGDTIELNLPMPVRRVVCHENVVENRNRIALERGPVVYCIEAADSPTGQVRNMIIDPEAAIETEFRPEMLGGIQVLTFETQTIGLGQDDQRMVESSQQVTAIPYAVWCNRGPNEMMVWLPTEKAAAFVEPRPTTASQSTATASPGTGRAGALVSGIEPRSSHDKDNEFYHWWPRKGTSEWVQFEFDEPTALSAVEVYWLDDTGQGECRIPQSWRLMYRDGEQWKQVIDSNGYGTQTDMYNRTAFTEITTNKVRLEIRMHPDYSAGVLQVRFD